MWWNNQSWKQISEIDKATPVIIPLGSCEQHGPHLPVFVDTLQLDGILARVEPLLQGKAVFLPILWLGSSHHHADFPGTLSLTPFLYSQALVQLLQCVIRANFKRIFILNGHGGNEVPALQAMNELICTNEEANSISLALATWWKVSKNDLDPIALGMETPCLSHACEYETSITLALRPELVRMDAVPGDWQESRPWALKDSLPNLHGAARFHRFTTTGAMGRPAAASADKGERLLEAVSQRLVRIISDYANWPILKKGESFHMPSSR